MEWREETGSRRQEAWKERNVLMKRNVTDLPSPWPATELFLRSGSPKKRGVMFRT
jgi:hypothetical protein